MFGIGIPELVLILIVGLIVFGPSKLPEVGRAVGKGLREFRKASNALSVAINAEEEPAPPAQPKRTPPSTVAAAATQTQTEATAASMVVAAEQAERQDAPPP